MLLAIDTATRYAGLALYDGQSLQAELTWSAVRRHTVTLVPNLWRVLHQQGLPVSDLTGLAVALGPGSYTGLRIGLGVAKGLALALDLPVVGVPTMDIVVHAMCAAAPRQGHMPLPLASGATLLRALLEAGRGRYCVADYRWTDGGFQREGDYRVVESNEVAEGVGERALFCGELDESVENALRVGLGDRAVIASPASRLRRAGYLAELGWERLARGQANDPATLSPIYLPFKSRQ